MARRGHLIRTAALFFGSAGGSQIRTLGFNDDERAPGAFFVHAPPARIPSRSSPGVPSHGVVRLVAVSMQLKIAPSAGFV